MSRLRYAAIWFLDWVVDVRVLGHRIPRYCDWLANHSWWGNEKGAKP
jgi:hypothetical protein